jgi:hypothetical protein
MRKLSAAALTAINLSSPKFLLLGEIYLSSSILRITSSSFDVVFKGDTYSSQNSVIGFGPPRVSSSVDREVYELTFLDQDNLIQNELRIGITGKQLTVYAVFFDQFDWPLLGEEDVLVAYRGRIDTGKVINDGSTKQAVLSATSPMAALDSIAGYIVSKDGMDQISTTDTSFDDIYVGGKSVNLKWGKK